MLHMEQGTPYKKGSSIPFLLSREKCSPSGEAQLDLPPFSRVKFIMDGAVRNELRESGLMG